MFYTYINVSAVIRARWIAGFELEEKRRRIMWRTQLVLMDPELAENNDLADVLPWTLSGDEFPAFFLTGPVFFLVHLKNGLL